MEFLFSLFVNFYIKIFIFWFEPTKKLENIINIVTSIEKFLFGFIEHFKMSSEHSSSIQQVEHSTLGAFVQNILDWQL